MIARACPVPQDGLLQAYVGQGATYTDCFEVMSPLAVSLPEFIEAFYTTWLFRLERFVLQIILRRRIKNAEVSALAQGGDTFAAWTVEARGEGQVLLCDFAGRTRSYLAISAKDGGVTRLLFGSAVVAQKGQLLGRGMQMLLPAHRLYSRLLLRLAVRKLRYS